MAGEREVKPRRANVILVDDASIHIEVEVPLDFFEIGSHSDSRPLVLKVTLAEEPEPLLIPYERYVRDQQRTAEKLRRRIASGRFLKDPHIRECLNGYLAGRGYRLRDPE